MLLSLNAFAQNDVTKFLGIPVDGSKQDMIKKIEAKGFKYDKANDFLEGEFNGRNVYVMVGTIRNKVYRIAVADKDVTRSESQIRIRFNSLCNQFSNSSKYVAFEGKDFKISDDEDITYEMAVNDKSYQATFFQIPDPDRKKCVWFTIFKNYGEYSICIYYDNIYNQNTDDDI